MRPRPEAPVDRDLIERAKHGDREAYEVLLVQAARRLYPVAFRILREGDGADDAVQQALVLIWRDLPRLREIESFDGWSYRILMRVCLSETRRRRERPVIRLIDLDVEGRDEVGPAAERADLERAFRDLSFEHRAALVLHHYAGFSVPQVAAALDIPEGTAKSRIHHATRAMRTALGRPAIAMTGERTA